MSTPDPQPHVNIGFRESIEAVAYRRGLLKGAEIAERSVIRTVRPKYLATALAKRITDECRSEADTPGTAP